MSPARLLARLSAAPPLVLGTWLLVTLPLLLAGLFRPWLAAGLFLPAAAAALWWGVRLVPQRRAGPVWAVLAVIAVAVAFGVVQGLMVSEQIVVRRDPASYAQFTIWLAKHGSLPIPPGTEVFGHTPWMSYESPAFYERGAGGAAGPVIYPQFMAGLPLVLAAGHWIAGLPGVLLGAPALGAAGVLTFGGLVSRLVGPRWAPLGALALALCWPILYVSRSTYSEAAALILLVGGLVLVLDARELPGRAGMSRAGLAGLVLGLVVLVRIDGLRDVLPVAVFALLALLVGRQRQGLPLAAGLAVGAGYGLVEGYVLSWPYLNHLSGELRPLLGICAGALALTVLGGVLVRRERRRGGHPLARLSRFRLPEAASALVLLAVAGLAVRPWLQETHTDTTATANFIGALQRYRSLPVEPTRLYYENSLYWVVWYVGLPVLLLATFGAALLVWLAARGHAPRWLPVLPVLLWTTATVLWFPGITPDHPWASRRLATLVVPAMILLAVWALAWLTRFARRLGWPPPATAGVVAVGSVAVALPPLVTSAPLMFTPVERGEAAAVHRTCDYLRESFDGRAAVVFVEPLSAARYMQVIRGMCGVPTARLTDPTPQRVAVVAESVTEAGRTPVLASWNAGPLRERVRAEPVRVMDLRARRDTSVLVQPPRDTLTLELKLWLARPDPAVGE